MEYVGYDPNSGLKQSTKGCTKGKKCTRPHAVSAKDPYGDIMKDQLEHFKSPNAASGMKILPHVRGTLARQRQPKDNAGLSFQLVPPMQEAMQVFSVSMHFRTCSRRRTFARTHRVVSVCVCA